MKKSKPSTVSKSSNPYGSVQIPSSEIRNIEVFIAVKKPHSMTSVYLGPIKTTDVEPDVVASTKGFVAPKVVGSVESSEKYNSSTVSLDKPKSDKTLDQSSMNVADKDTIDTSIRVLISYILGIEPKFVVVPNVTTSLAQTNHPVETSLEKYDGKSNSESVPIKPPKKSEEKNDFDSMSDKEENSGVKKDQSTNIVNVDDLDYDDEFIGKRLALGIDKRLKSRKGKTVESTSKPLKAPKKSTSVGSAKGWSKVVTSAIKKRSLKRREVPSSSSDSDFDVEHDIPDIVPSTRKKTYGKKVPDNIPEVLIDNISFHYVENVEK